MISEIALQLEGATSCSLSIDGWSSIRMNSFTGVMIHFFDREFNLRAYCVGTCRFNKANGKPASAENLSIQIKEMLNDFPLCGNKKILEATRAITTDATNVMPALSRSLGKSPQKCISHQLQLLAKTYVTSQDHLCVMVGLACRISAHIRMSTKAIDTIGQVEGYVRTRFDSYLHLLDSLVAKFEAIQNYAALPGIGLPRKFSQALREFSSLLPYAQVVSKILKPFAVLTATLGAQETPTFQKVLKAVHYLEYVYSTLASSENIELQNQAKIMMEILKTRFAYLLDSREHLLATILCPSNRKMLTQLGEAKLTAAKDYLLFELKMIDQEVPQLPQPSQTNQLQLPLGSQIVSFDDFLTTPVITSRAEMELDLYLNFPSESNLDIQSFWRRNEATFPLMSRVARSILCIPASSLACERLFSRAGAIVTKQRNKLSADRVNSLTRSRVNLLCLEGQSGLPVQLMMRMRDSE